MGKKTDKIFERARANLQKENHENALRLFNEVLNREPGHKQALRSKGLIKILEDDFKEAEEFLLFATEQQPEDDQLYQMLGTLYHNNSQTKKALSCFNKAVELNDDNLLAHQGLGIIYSQILGKHENAISHFSKAINLSEDTADLLFNRGCSYMILKQMSKSEKDLRQAKNLGHAKAKEMVDEYFN